MEVAAKSMRLQSDSLVPLVAVVVFLGIGCSRSSTDVPTQDVTQPVEVTSGQSAVAESITIEGRFAYDKGPLPHAVVQIEKTANGGRVVCNSKGARLTKQGDGHYAYRVVLTAPPQPGDYEVVLKYGADTLGTQPLRVSEKPKTSDTKTEPL
jgi:hypothetical protein